VVAKALLVGFMATEVEMLLLVRRSQKRKKKGKKKGEGSAGIET